ncbi:uncharacterized protein TRUGW13939_00426 [Talaromyces rugulosus]|uniref:Selenoprotein W-like protein n=1 Tax=Talaromyces rugulosus TaxID=121627 RepID=A0A7H8QHA5_TALRU|nr:uncharacterized protein TRUGW13939_00426 [Talaromyces rugulosus]QKX53348.1 hypothetical protein TRUGW13939_00426 [Talaromyces rugulosus]
MTEQTPTINQQPPPTDKVNPPETSMTGSSQVHLPRITIKFCTQCKWMLRAAYFGQELLSTFGTGLGEVALIPVTGGVFTVTMYHASPSSATNDDTLTVSETLLWDRKTHGGFPEVKQLKSLVRNIIDPSRDLGHVDRALKASKTATSADAPKGNGDTLQTDQRGKDQGKEDDTNQESQKDACQDCQ